MYQYR